MAVLTEKQRKETGKMHYLLPGKKMFPTPDHEHAVLAEEEAKRALDSGDITREEYHHVRRAAKRRAAELSRKTEKHYADEYGRVLVKRV